MATCLFTGIELSKSTKQEHAILSSLGGRIVSKELTSDVFNEKCGSKIDKYLTEQFEQLLRTLGPLLSSKLKNKKQQLFSSDGQRHYEKQNGKIYITKPFISENSETNKKTCYYSESTRDETIKLAKKENFSTSESKEKKTDIPDDFLYTGEKLAISPESYISTIKCFLCAFDAMEGQNGIEETKRFSRHPKLSSVRDYIKKFVLNDEEIKISAYDKFFLGIQPDGKKRVQRVLEKYKIKKKIKPYSHILIVSTNSPTKTINGLWSFFGLETHALRLADNWDGPPFSKVIINPIIGDESPKLYSGEELPNSLCCKTKYKGFSYEKAQGQLLDNDIIPYISEIRQIEYRESISFLELNADALVIKNFHKNLKNIPPESNIEDLIYKHLSMVWPEVPVSKLKETISKLHSPTLIKWRRCPVLNWAAVDKDTFLAEYRQIFLSLIDEYDHPGAVKIRSIKTEDCAIINNRNTSE
ncbi:MAG: hypothetical protein WCS73_08215 [Lentisphaeria bacterium]